MTSVPERSAATLDADLGEADPGAAPAGAPRRYYRPDARHPERLASAVGDDGADAADLTAAAIDGALRAFILDVHYPCVGAKSAVHNGSYRLGVYGALAEPGHTAALAGDLASFVADADAIDAEFATFVAVFEGPADLDPEAFEQRLWQELQLLHDADAASWDRDVSDDPGDPHFSYSFAGTAFFVVGLHPGSERLSRRFPWPALVFNPHAQFERLRAEDRWARMQDVIRRKETELQGDINPVLRDFGEASEARQYSGRPVEPGWQAPFAARPTGPHGSPETRAAHAAQDFARCPASRVAALLDRARRAIRTSS